MERLVVICDREEITSEHLPEELRKMLSQARVEEAREQSYKEAKEEFEREFLRRAIQKYRSTRRAAERLGVDHSTLVKKAAKYAIKLLPRWS
jgi:TyrR family helix-turn-helix protein